jgi:hypothetical protein
MTLGFLTRRACTSKKQTVNQAARQGGSPCGTNLFIICNDAAICGCQKQLTPSFNMESLTVNTIFLKTTKLYWLKRKIIFRKV